MKGWTRNGDKYTRFFGPLQCTAYQLWSPNAAEPNGYSCRIHADILTLARFDFPLTDLSFHWADARQLGEALNVCEEMARRTIRRWSQQQ